MTTDAQQDAGQQGDEEYVEGGPAADAAHAQVEQPLTAEAAQAQIATRQQDRAWMGEYFKGDKAKSDEMARLYNAAFPANPGATPASDGVIPRQDSAAGAATEEWLAPPRAAHEYNFNALQGETPSKEDRALQTEIKRALHAEGVPTVAVSVVVNEMARLTKDGLPDEAALERSKAAGLASLELRHGKDGARQLLAAAQKVYQRLEARDPRICDLLCESGAGNSAYVIETLARLPSR